MQLGEGCADSAACVVVWVVLIAAFEDGDTNDQYIEQQEKNCEKQC